MVGGIWKSILQAATARLSVTNSADGNPASASRITTGNSDTVGLEIKGTAAGGSAAPGSTLFATFATSLNATSSNGSGTGTSHNGAAISGGMLDLTAGGTPPKYLQFAAAANFAQTQIFTVRFNVKPAYSGTPGNRMYWFSRTDGGGSNYVQLWHSTDGNVHIAGSGFSGDFGAWNPTSGTTYEIELDLDIATGATRLFIDGVQHGSTDTTTGTMAAPANFQLGIGYDFDLVNHPPNFSMSNFVVFSTIKHTSNFTGEIPRTYAGQAADLQRWLSPSGSVLAKLDSAGDFSVALTDSTFWNGTPPVTMNEALDRCAALLKTLNSGTGP